MSISCVDRVYDQDGLCLGDIDEFDFSGDRYYKYFCRLCGNGDLSPQGETAAEVKAAFIIHLDCGHNA